MSGKDTRNQGQHEYKNDEREKHCLCMQNTVVTVTNFGLQKLVIFLFSFETLRMRLEKKKKKKLKNKFVLTQK